MDYRLLFLPVKERQLIQGIRNKSGFIFRFKNL